MDPTKLLEADHRQVESLIEQISEAKGSERQSLLDELRTSFLAHAELEEQVVYPAMEPVTGKEVVEEGVTEHELARTALEQVYSLAPDDPGFGAALDAAKAGIEHHVHDEENEVFPKLRKEGRDQLASMRSSFIQKREELGLPLDAATIESVSTKEELLEQAQAVEVRGAASMTKTELAEAIAEKLRS